MHALGVVLQGICVRETVFVSFLLLRAEEMDILFSGGCFKNGIGLIYLGMRGPASCSLWRGVV